MRAESSASESGCGLYFSTVSLPPAICLFLILAGFQPVIDLLESWAKPWLVDTVTSFSVITHFEGFQKGVLDSRDVIFFLSVIGFSLFCTSVILRGHRAG